ncbi:MAG: geranylgeranyl reductase family protein [Nitrospirota bacterium]
MASNIYDVIVVGGGPAGSSCATVCAHQGMKTLLIDRDTFPRSKPCGGAISEQALSYLDFVLPEEIIEKECYGARIHFKGYHVEVRKDYRLAVLVSREKFDNFLLVKTLETGAHILQGQKVIGLRIYRDHVDVTTENESFRASYVVGADGVNSYIATHVRPPLQNKEKLFAIVSEIQAPNEVIDRRLDRIIDIYFGLVPLGYGWVFPHSNYYSLGVGGRATEFQHPRKVLSDFGESVGLTITSSQGHFIPIGGIRRKMAIHRILLVGDAAGLADPFIGEGIAYAIRSGKLAALTIADSLKKGILPDKATAAYESACKQFIVREISFSWKMTKIIYQFPDLFLRLFASDKRILQKYLEIPSCRIHYRNFLLWLITRLPLYSCAIRLQRRFH